MKTQRRVQFIVLVSLTVICFTAFYKYDLSCSPNALTVQVPTQTDSPSIETKIEDVEGKHGRVYACIFTGRWMFLRVLLSYLYRELRQNGGVVDRVLFAMLGNTSYSIFRPLPTVFYKMRSFSFSDSDQEQGRHCSIAVKQSKRRAG